MIFRFSPYFAIFCCLLLSPPTGPAEDTAAMKHTNKLAKEKSPYLLQHAHNPVNWFPWGDEAFALAKKENKPILLSIGYSTCHWCHVMERESFENEEIAKVLNDHFIAIKLDREERPDVDNIYMTAMQALDMGGGWPLNVFITPERKPFFGGTYFKPTVFKGLLEQISTKWKTDADPLHKDANNIAKGLAEMMDKVAPKDAGPLKAAWGAETVAGILKSYDPKHAGFVSADPQSKNKFPRSSVPDLVLLHSFRGGKKDDMEKIFHTCRRMAAGGMYDALGGGFARYSTDAEWLVPHFEKMLYDNAQLVTTYLDAYLLSGDHQYADVVKDTLNYIAKRMTSPEGGFYCAEDADSEGHEGKYYTWTKEELQKLLSAEEFAFVEGYFTITDEGNFLDHSHPAPLKKQNILARKYPEKAPLPPGDAMLSKVREKLLAVQVKRIPPHLDDKILASGNGLMLAALAKAGCVLQDPAYHAAARKNLVFVKSKLWDDATKTLYHRYRDGERDKAQLLSGYASYLHGCVALYEATVDPAVLSFSLELADAMVKRFYDEKQGGFFTSMNTDDLLFRVKDEYDGAEPCGNSLAIYAILKLAVIAERPDLRQKADKSLAFFTDRLAKGGESAPIMMQAMDFALHEPYRVVIAGDAKTPEATALLAGVHGVYQPGKVVLGNVGPVEKFATEQPAKDNKPTAYVCTGNACRLPTHDVGKVKEYLKAATSPRK
jgi:uncharacterized protein